MLLARVAELVDALASGASDRKIVGVQVPPRAQNFFGVSPWVGPRIFVFMCGGLGLVGVAACAGVAEMRRLATVEFDFGARVYPKEAKTVSHVTIHGCFGVVWLQSADSTVAKRVLGAEVGEALRVNAAIAGYPPLVRGFSFDVLGNWPILGRKREQNEQKWCLVNTLD